MMKCVDCGNTTVFREPQIEWQKVPYTESGEVENAEHICYESVDDFESIECDVCDSRNIAMGDDDDDDDDDEDDDEQEA